MYKRKPIRLIALLMTLCMLLSVLPSSGVRTEAVETEELKELETASAAETQLSSAAQTLSEDCKILNYVQPEVFASAKHVARITSEETLNSYVFLNEDGTRTAYFMDEAVKYVDEKGLVQEKDLTLVPAVGGYTTEKNDISLSIPTNPASGVTLLWNNTAVRIIPQGGTVGETVVEDNTVRYVDYYGNGMDLVYTPTLSGLKEDIVLQNYAGKNTFTFMLNTGGLNLYSASGRYYLAASKTATDRIDLGDVVTFDARGRFSVGTMSAQTVTAGQIYRLTLTVDEDFLTDPNTVYPVSIDPTLTVSDNTHGAGAIEDVSIYQGRPTINANWTYLHSGYYDSNYTVARTLIRLTGLINSSVYQGLTANQISSVQFHIWEASGTATTSVYLRANTGSATWTESGATWNNAGVVLGTTYDTQNLISNSKATFNITQLVKDWKSGTQNAQKGFVLQSSNETSLDKAFYSSEHGTTTKRPYVELNYSSTENAIGLLNTKLSITKGNIASVGVTTTPSDLSVTWTSSNPSVATVDSTGRVTAVNAGKAIIIASASGAVSQSCTVYVTLSQNSVYRVQNKAAMVYLDCNGANISEENLTNIKVRSSSSSGNDALAQLWRFTYVDDGYYFIRPMHKLDYGLYIDEGDVKLTYIGTNNTLASAPEKARWTIEYIDGGYVFKCAGSNVRTLQPFAGVASNNSIVNATLYDSTAEYQKWLVNPITPTPKGMLLYNIVNDKAIDDPTMHTVYVGVGQTKTVEQLFLAVGVYSTGFLSQDIELSLGSNSIAAVNTNTNAVAGIAPGTTTLTITSSEDTSISRTISLKVTDNTFHIKHYYDSSFSTNKTAFLDEAVAFTDHAYAKMFSVSFRQIGNPTMDTVTGISSCPVGATGHCTDNQCGSPHCKDVFRICEELLESRTVDNMIPVLWTHRDAGFYCNSTAGDLTYGENVYATTVNSKFSILMMRQNASTDNANISFMSIVLAHEIAHAFGFEDNYDRNSHKDDDWQCVMEYTHSEEDARWEFFQQVLLFEDDAFCEDCKEDIADYLSGLD